MSMGRCAQPTGSQERTQSSRSAMQARNTSTLWMIRHGERCPKPPGSQDGKHMHNGKYSHFSTVNDSLLKEGAK